MSSTDHNEGGNGAATTIAIAASLQGLQALDPWLEDLRQRFTISDEMAFAIRLCLEEAVSNVVNHAHIGDAGEPIAVSVTDTPDELVFVVVDGGPPFDPRTVAPPAEVTDLETAPIGGQGINLIRSFASRFDYERRDERNRLSLGFSR